ncbi:hypothetical protein DL98DRAFT_276889 [Cadophora sp. DSE1049]|nr:hypothetical protein DL98DRAFT_276889 [Cadophora sp. DSE1049]
MRSNNMRLAHLTFVASPRSLFRSCLSYPLCLCNGSPASLQGQLDCQLGLSGQKSAASALNAIVQCAGTSSPHSIASRLSHVMRLQVLEACPVSAPRFCEFLRLEPPGCVPSIKCKIGRGPSWASALGI